MPNMRLLAVTAMLVTSCGPRWSYKVMTGPNGEPVGAITCNYDVADCYSIAANACPAGYDVVGGSPEAYTLIVRCRPGPVVARQ